MSSHLRGQLYPFLTPNLLHDGCLHSSTRAQEPLYDSFRMHPYSLRHASIYSLPVELLTRIFILGAGYDFPYNESPFLLKPDQDYYAIPSSRFQLLVSHICRHWRQIALQTSSLWSILHFREPVHLPRAKEYLSRLSRSNHFLDILVDTVAERDHIPGVTLCREEIHQVFDIICPYVRRWRAFHLKVRDHECKAAARHHLSSCGPAPNLETLQLYHFEDYLTSQNLYLATYRPPVKVFSNDLPCLKNISLIGVNLPWEHSPYLVHLHNLELALHPENIRPPYEYWENMLRSSPDLRTLSLHYSGPRVANGDAKLVWPTNKERIIIESLENLSLTDLDPDYLCRLMGRLVLPGLKQLSLDLPDQNFTSFIELISCQIAPSPPPNPRCLSHLPFPSLFKLHTLVITALEASTASLRTFLRSLHDLRTLEVHFASVSNNFHQLLTEGMDVEVNTDGASTSSRSACHCGIPLRCPSVLGDVVVIKRVPLLPSLQTFKLSGLTGDELKRLLQSREVLDLSRLRTGKKRELTKWDVAACKWIVKWSEKRKGKDKVLDQLVERGWAARDGQTICLDTFDDEELDDDEEDEDENIGGGVEDGQEVGDGEEDVENEEDDAT